MADGQQYDTAQIDEVQHPTLGPLKFPHAMPPDERNKIIADMESKAAPAATTTEPASKSFFQRVLAPRDVPRSTNEQISQSGMPGSFEGRPENVGEYVPRTIMPMVQAGKDIGAGKYAKAAHEAIGGLSNAALPAAPFLVAGAPLMTTLRGIASGAAGQYAAQKGASALGATEDQANLAGDIGGVAGGLFSDNIGESAANLLKSSAKKNYEAVLNPTRIDTKFQTQKMMPKLMEEKPIAMTRQGLADKAAANADIEGQKVESVVSNLKGSMNTQPVIDGLESLKQRNQVNGVSLRPEVDSAIDQVSAQMKSMGPDISYQDAVKARRILDSAVQEAKGYTGAQLSDKSMASIRREAANSIRGELAKASPDLAAVNAKFHFWNSLSDVMDATLQRKTGQLSTNLPERIQIAAAGSGALAKEGITAGASYAGAMYALGKVVNSTGWRTVSAATKLNIADALAGKDFGTVQRILSTVPVAVKAASDSAPQ